MSKSKRDLRRSRQAFEDLVGCLDHGAALFADEVAMGPGGQVVGGRAVPEMGVDDDPEALEVVEVSIDRRDVDLGRLRLDLGARAPRRCDGLGTRRALATTAPASS